MATVIRETVVTGTARCRPGAGVRPAGDGRGRRGARRAFLAAAEHHEDGIAWRLAAVLRCVHSHQNAFDGWITTATVGAQAATRLGDLVGVAETHDSLGKAYFQSMRLTEAEAAHRVALDTRRDLGDLPGQVVSPNALGLLELRRRRLTDAGTCFRRAADVAEGLGDQQRQALIRGNIAETFTERREHVEAVDLLEGILPVLRATGDRAYAGNALFLLVRAHRGTGRPDRARLAVDEAPSIADGDGNDVWRAYWLIESTAVHLAAGRPAEALREGQRAAALHRRPGDRNRQATALDVTGPAHQDLGHQEEAVPFHRRAADAHRAVGDRWHQANAPDNLARALERSGGPRAPAGLSGRPCSRWETSTTRRRRRCVTGSWRGRTPVTSRAAGLLPAAGRPAPGPGGCRDCCRCRWRWGVHGSGADPTIQIGPSPHSARMPAAGSRLVRTSRILRSSSRATGASRLPKNRKART